MFSAEHPSWVRPNVKRELTQDNDSAGHVPSKRGRYNTANNINTTALFCERIDGTVMGGMEIDAMRHDLYALLNDLLRCDVTIHCDWAENGADIQDAVVHELERRFPALALCVGHIKAKSFIGLYYRVWVKKHFPEMSQVDAEATSSASSSRKTRKRKRTDNSEPDQEAPPTNQRCTTQAASSLPPALSNQPALSPVLLGSPAPPSPPAFSSPPALTGSLTLSGPPLLTGPPGPSSPFSLTGPLAFSGPPAPPTLSTVTPTLFTPFTPPVVNSMPPAAPSAVPAPAAVPIPPTAVPAPPAAVPTPPAAVPTPAVVPIPPAAVPIPPTAVPAPPAAAPAPPAAVPTPAVVPVPPAAVPAPAAAVPTPAAAVPTLPAAVPTLPAAVPTLPAALAAVPTPAAPSAIPIPPPPINQLALETAASEGGDDFFAGIHIAQPKTVARIGPDPGAAETEAAPKKKSTKAMAVNATHMSARNLFAVVWVHYVGGSTGEFGEHWKAMLSEKDPMFKTFELLAASLKAKKVKKPPTADEIQEYIADL